MIFVGSSVNTASSRSYAGSSGPGVSGFSRTTLLGFSVNGGNASPYRVGEASLLEHSVQCRASGVRRKGQAMGRRHRRRHRASRGAFQLGRAVVAAVIIIVLVFVILRLLDVY